MKSREINNEQIVVEIHRDMCVIDIKAVDTYYQDRQEQIYGCATMIAKVDSTTAFSSILAQAQIKHGGGVLVWGKRRKYIIIIILFTRSGFHKYNI